MSRMLVVAAAALVALSTVPAALASASGVVISEFRFRGPTGASDEFVELLNASSADVDVSGWKLQACSATTGSATTRAAITAGTTLAAGQHALFTNTSYSGSVVGDFTYGTGIADGGGVRVVTGEGGSVDGVASSAAPTSECREGTGLSLPTAESDASLERKLGGAQDTDDNAADFDLAVSDPENRSSTLASLTIDDVSVAEGEIAFFTVSLSTPAARTVSVEVATADGSATAADDYASTVGVLSLAPGTTSATVAVDVVDDALDEVDETFEVVLSAPARATLADAVGVATIHDDDEPPVVTPANTPGSVLVAGHVDGVGVLLARVAYTAGASAPEGVVRFVHPGRGVVFVSTGLTSLVIDGPRVSVRGTAVAAGAAVAFQLELDGPDIVLSGAGTSISGRLRGALLVRMH